MFTFSPSKLYLFMKKAGIALLLLFATNHVWAQISLNLPDMAGPGDVIINSSQNYSGTTPPAGSNISYSFLESDTTFQDTIVFVTAASTPFGASFPTSTMATGSFGNYGYYKLNNTGLSLTGFVFDFGDGGGGLGLPFSSAVFPINPEIKVLNFPATMGMNIQSQGTSSFEFPFDTVINVNGIPATITKARINATILDTSTIDGYGNAEFVAGTIPVLRNIQSLKMTFKIQVFAKISILPAVWIDLPASVLDPSLIPVISTKTLSFWANGKKSAVAEFSLDSNNNVTSADYLKEMLLLTSNRSLLSVRPDFEFQAAPNPALNDVSFSSDAILKKVKIFSVTGQKMLEKDFQLNEYRVQVDALTNGVYVAELENEKGGKSQKRLIINR